MAAGRRPRGHALCSHDWSAPWAPTTCVVWQYSGVSTFKALGFLPLQKYVSPTSLDAARRVFRRLSTPCHHDKDAGAGWGRCGWGRWGGGGVSICWALTCYPRPMLLLSASPCGATPQPLQRPLLHRLPTRALHCRRPHAQASQPDGLLPRSRVANLAVPVSLSQSSRVAVAASRGRVAM